MDASSRTTREMKMGPCIAWRARLFHATNSAMPPLKWKVSGGAAWPPVPLPLLEDFPLLPLLLLLLPAAPRVSKVIVAVRFKNATSRSRVRMVSTSKVTLQCSSAPVGRAYAGIVDQLIAELPPCNA